jgi:hypothetical protein
MGAPEKERKSVLGLGVPVSSDPNAWRPSEARCAQDSGLAMELTAEKQAPVAQEKSGATGEAAAAEQRDAALNTRDGAAAAWRPSRVNAERLSSLSPERARRRFAMPRWLRPALTVTFFVCAAYAFFKLWFMPTAGGLHPALAISAGVLALLAVLFIVGAVVRRRRKSSDDKSTLRL